MNSLDLNFIKQSGMSEYFKTHILLLGVNTEAFCFTLYHWGQWRWCDFRYGERGKGQVTSSLRHAEWFHDSGITPDGQWWIAPTSLFIEQIWQSCAGDDLQKRGFRLGNDGHSIGASQHTVIYLPVGEL